MEPQAWNPTGADTGAIVLAAGRSRRMGADKLVAEAAGKPVIVHVVERIAAAGLPPPIVVISPEGEAVRAALAAHTVTVAVAQDSAAGMSRSLRAGIAAAPDSWHGALICLGDMPLIPADLLREMASEAGPDSIFVPRHRGRPGNPVLWGRAYFARLAALDGDAGARTLFGELVGALRFFDTADPGVAIDVDTPELLEAVQRQFTERG